MSYETSLHFFLAIWLLIYFCMFWLYRFNQFWRLVSKRFLTGVVLIDCIISLGIIGNLISLILDWANTFLTPIFYILYHLILTKYLSQKNYKLSAWSFWTFVLLAFTWIMILGDSFMFMARIVSSY